MTVLTGVLTLGVALAAPVSAGSERVDDGPLTRNVSSTTENRPNIILVLADDMRADEMRYMPHVQSLIADDGVTFENSFSPYPLCCPARASLLSGQYAHNHQVLGNSSPYGFGSFDDSKTIATAMNSAGYNAGMVGKYLNEYGKVDSLVTGGPSANYVPAGWTDWFVSITGAHDHGETGSTYNYRVTPYNNNGVFDDSKKGQYQTKVLGDVGVSLIDKYANEPKPFFLFMSFVAPHNGGPREKDDPVHVRAKNGTYRNFASPNRPRGIRGKLDSEIPHSPGLPADGSPAEPNMKDKPLFMRHPPFTPAERVALRDVARQRAEALTILDRQVARLVARLKRDQEWSNTVIAFSSDNGYFLGEHRQRPGKVKAHEPSLRVPLVIRGPGIAQDVVSYDPITTVDLSTTLMDLGGALEYAPRPPDGVSKAQTIEYGDQGWTAPVVTEGITATPGDADGFDDARTYIGLRTARYSYIRYATGETELYDLVADPNEFRNRAGDSQYAAVQQELLKAWYHYKDCVADQCRTPLPTDLQASPSQEAQMTDYFWNRVFAVYGY